MFNQLFGLSVRNISMFVPCTMALISELIKLYNNTLCDKFLFCVTIKGIYDNVMLV